MNYAKNLPLDKNNYPYETIPSFVSNQSQSGAPSTSSVISLSDKTTVLDVTVFSTAAGNAVIIGKWGPSSVTATNFDWAVQAGQYRTFVVPQSIAGTSSVSGVNVAYGLYNSVAVKSLSTVASVLTVEF